MSIVPVIRDSVSLLVHTPELTRYGSKPYRELRKKPELESAFREGLRSYSRAVSYPPNQVFVGNLAPDDLHAVLRPWHAHPVPDAHNEGPFGEILPEAAFLATLKMFDLFDLLLLEQEFVRHAATLLGQHPLIDAADLDRLGAGLPADEIASRAVREGNLPILHEGRTVGCMQRAHEEDESLSAHILLENLACKASGILALRRLLRGGKARADEIEYILSCSEEASGDRYNRGGGNLAKAIGELGPCPHATGADVKSFCAAPIHAIVIAAGLVASGLYKNVAVVGGGSVPKLGMKFESHLAKEMPILEDCLGAIALLVSADDGESPVIRLDAVGRHEISSGSSQQAILEALVVRPLEKLGRRLDAVGKYATEMHNPEITLPAERGDVPRNNYMMIGAMSVKRGERRREDLEEFVRIHGMPGFAPTQGHIPAGMPFMPHALGMIRSGQIDSAMFIAKGSLFLGRMTHQSDGMSFLLERNPRTGA